MENVKEWYDMDHSIGALHWLLCCDCHCCCCVLSTIECDYQMNQSLMYHLVTMPWTISSHWHHCGHSHHSWNCLLSKWQVSGQGCQLKMKAKMKKLHFHACTHDLVYQGINVEFIFAYMAANKTKPLTNKLYSFPDGILLTGLSVPSLGN